MDLVQRPHRPAPAAHCSGQRRPCWASRGGGLRGPASTLAMCVAGGGGAAAMLAWPCSERPAAALTRSLLWMEGVREKTPGSVFRVDPASVASHAPGAQGRGGARALSCWKEAREPRRAALHTRALWAAATSRPVSSSFLGPQASWVSPQAGVRRRGLMGIGLRKPPSDRLALLWAQQPPA